MNGITALAHVALKVKDLDRSLDFYVNKLGFSEMMRLSKPDGSPGVWLVYLRITDDQFLELFPGGAGDQAPGSEAVAINHICLGVDDIDVTLAYLKEKGVPLTVQKKMAADRNWQAWVQDPDGNRIELMQLAADSMQLEAIALLRSAGR